jgi:galactosamine-6-phosphate isomerase
MNGHIALNEPAEFLQAHCHVAELSPKTLQHPMAIGMEMKPTYGQTLGMADIMHAKHIVLIIHGEQKKAITKALLSGNISTSLPASLLWLHPNVTCLIEKEAME